ncbi:putative toxin [Nocardia arizonensis]|uniref:putative toxin n=1 Tax=Nocardia arizonensis TaxID=1141647 RepID=UPI0006D2A6CA|nr:putative toxin [Nocardia arizonensis]
MTDLNVDPELFYELAGAYSRASTSTSAALRQLDNELRSAVKMTGGDDGGLEWGGKYHKAAVEAVVTAGIATDVLCRMAALVRQSGVNHDESENAEEYNKPGGALPEADPGGESFTARPPKNPGGGTRAEPTGWKVVMGAVKWVDGDTGLLQKAAASWSTTATKYNTLDTEIKSKMKLLNGSTAPEIPDIDQTNTTVLDGTEILGDAMLQLSGATSGYADILEAAQEAIEWELQVQTVVQAINVIDAATVGRPITKIIRETAEAEIDNSNRKITQILVGLADARRVSGGMLDAVSTTVTSSVNTKFKPVLDKQLKRPPEPTKADQARQNKLKGAKAESRAGIDPTKKKESLPSPSRTARNRTPDDLDHSNRRLTEVKNVDKQEYTDQLKDFLSYSQTNGYELVLITDNRTKLAPEIEDLVKQGKIKHVRMDLNS